MSKTEKRPPPPNESLELAELMLYLFKGRDDRIGVDNGSGVMSEKLDTPLTASELHDEHLSQEICLAVYPLLKDGTVWHSCIDLDDKDHKPDERILAKVIKFVNALKELGLSPVVEKSQSGRGFHIWLFFQAPIQARLIRAFWIGLCHKLKLPVPEIFPKQDAVKPGQVGNCIRYPLFNQSSFIEIDGDNEVELDPLKTLKAVHRLRVADLEGGAERGGINLSEQITSKPVGGGLTPEGLPLRVAALLADPQSNLHKRWHGDTSRMNDPSRSSIVSAIACELVRNFVPTPEIRTALEAWCRTQKYDKGLREGWLDRVIDSAYAFVSDKFRTISKPKSIYHQFS